MAEFEFMEGMEVVEMAYAEPAFGVTGFGRVLVHSPERCAQDPNPCVLHSPSTHRMSDWPMVLRLDRGGLIERTCPHGMGHPDPDSLACQIRGYRETYDDPREDFSWVGDPSEDFSWVGTHGCDGCCREED